MQASHSSTGGIDAARIAELRETEATAFRKARPKSAARIGNGIAGFFGGVPMHWMTDWPTPFPILVDHARGATITDIDGNRLDAFCLGDTGSMFGHSPAPVARAIRRQAGRGLTYMLPSEDALAIGPLRSALMQMGVRPEQAARSLGYGRFETFLQVTLPRLRRPLVAGALMVFIVVVKELPIMLLLAPPGFSTLATKVFSYTSEGMLYEAAPYAALLVAFSSLFVGLVIRYEGQR